MWYIYTESKIQLVNCELSQNFPLEISSLPDICAINAYIFWLLSPSPFLDYFCDVQLFLSLKRTWFRIFLLSSGGFGHLAMIWSAHPHFRNNVKVYIQYVVCLHHQTNYLFPYPFLSFNFFFYRMVSNSTKSAIFLNNIWSFIVYTGTWTSVYI